MGGAQLAGVGLVRRHCRAWQLPSGRGVAGAGRRPRRDRAWTAVADPPGEEVVGAGGVVEQTRDLLEDLATHRVVHAVGRALVAEVETERLYVLSLGSRQGNRHVHWHLVPLPPGVPYEQQQRAALAAERGYLDIADREQADLARRLRARLDGAEG
jgi:hypothetical protein